MARASKKNSDKNADEPSASVASQSTKAPDRLLFYGVTNANGWLSQMYTSKFTHDRRTYVCAEQFFQYAKAALFEDSQKCRAIMATNDAKKHKSLGGNVAGFDDTVWNEVKYRVVVKATLLKFTTSEFASVLRRNLLKTGDQELVEASNDETWGCGMSKKKAEKDKGIDWPGANLLGKAIMEVRQKLQKEEKDKGSAGGNEAQQLVEGENQVQTAGQGVADAAALVTEAKDLGQELQAETLDERADEAAALVTEAKDLGQELQAEAPGKGPDEAATVVTDGMDIEEKQLQVDGDVGLEQNGDRAGLKGRRGPPIVQSDSE